MFQTISPSELDLLRRAGKPIEMLDVRTPAEYRELHVEFARNVPLDRIDPKAIQAARNNDTDQPLYVICRSGSRGRQACERLAAAGLVNVVNVEGGTLACETAGLPIIRGKKAISLERQVRIAAGLLVLVGSVLSVTVHPSFAGLSAFVGAGLVFSGITDTCGMAMILARMPWNQVAGKAKSADAACHVGTFLVSAAVLAPTTLFAAEHATDSLVTVQCSVAEQKVALINLSKNEESYDGLLRDAWPLRTFEQGVLLEGFASCLQRAK